MPKNDNPYWDEHIKPHWIETDEIRAICLTAFHIVRASYGVASHLYEGDEVDDQEENEELDPGPTRLLALHSERSERTLSNSLLKLSVLVRALDDQIRGVDDDGKFAEFVESLHAESSLGTLRKEAGSTEEIDLTIRETCNKIIHADDFRPVYHRDTGFDDGAKWAMDGTLELQGHLSKVEWHATIYLIEFLESVLAYCDKTDKLGSD